MSQMFTLTSRKGKATLSDKETLAEASRCYEEKSPKGKVGDECGKSTNVITREISHPMTEKAERLMGIKISRSPVRRDIDVESLMSRDEKVWEERQVIR